MIWFNNKYYFGSKSLILATAACANALAISYVKYSKLSARDEPAIAFSPKELIPVWMKTLETEKMAP